MSSLHKADSRISNLPSAQRRAAAEQKYAEAVELYASSDLSIREVAERCRVTASGLSAHIGKYHRRLLFARYGVSDDDESLRQIKVKTRHGQSFITHIKYKDAIEACGDMAYIEFNVSQVARLFNLNGPALASQLKVHYPGVIEAREALRKRLCIADNAHRGPRRWSIEAYAAALEIYRDTDLTIPVVAERCNVSKSGFCQFMRFYHKDVLAHKAARRKASVQRKGAGRKGLPSGNGGHYGPKPETVARYAQALELYRTTSLTIDDIVEQAGVPAAGFKGYLHRWHREEKLRRRGVEWDGIAEMDLSAAPKYLKSTAAKYASAISSLRANPRPVAEVAREFGHDPDVFRHYLKVHEPALVAPQGMTRLPNGCRVRQSAIDKYGKALEEYGSTPEPLKSIAARHGIAYNSIFNFIKRNCAELCQKHDRLAEEARQSQR